ncbi:MAG: electron transport complex subunit RsxA [Candidatus Wallbacteria bacterium]|nr:electron transport complex subunit RsxA [Candidatus Wallbacteria bacterium]
MFRELLFIIIGTVFVNNFVLSRFLGICPFIGVSKKLETAVGMGGAVVFVMGMASAVTWVIYYYILNPYHLHFLQTITFILVIASLVQFVELFLQKHIPALYQALGIYLPLISTNCAVLGVALLSVQKEYHFIPAVVSGIGAATGFTLALVLMAGIRERLELCDIPRPLQGVPIAFIVSALLATAFMGFAGMIPE